VFNPYSGVKTSILILDKSLAKQADTIAFFKVENDGFNLGAQRRPSTGTTCLRLAPSSPNTCAACGPAKALNPLPA